MNLNYIIDKSLTNAISENISNYLKGDSSPLFDITNITENTTPTEIKSDISILELYIQNNKNSYIDCTKFILNSTMKFLSRFNILSKYNEDMMLILNEIFEFHEFIQEKIISDYSGDIFEILLILNKTITYISDMLDSMAINKSIITNKKILGYMQYKKRLIDMRDIIYSNNLNRKEDDI